MSREAVEAIIGKAVVDSQFRTALFANPDQVLAGYDLTEEEIASLKAIDFETMESFAGTLDERISKVGFAFSLFGGAHPSGGAQPDAAHPMGAQPSAAHPMGAQPNAAHPMGAQPNAAHPIGAQPYAAHPMGAQPDAAHPMGAQPTGAQPDAAQPTGANPDAAQVAGSTANQ